MQAQPNQPPSPQHQSYIVRIWREEAGGPARFSVQNVTDGVRIGFATFDELCAYFWRAAQEQSTGTQE